VPVAANAVNVIFAMDFVGGATAIETGPSTVKMAEPLIAPDVALIVVVPVAEAVTSPPVLPMLATLVSEELHITELVRSLLGPLE
jgi:hypothetical protein